MFVLNPCPLRIDAVSVNVKSVKSLVALIRLQCILTTLLSAPSGASTNEATRCFRYIVSPILSVPEVPLAKVNSDQSKGLIVHDVPTATLTNALSMLAYLASATKANFLMNLWFRCICLRLRLPKPLPYAVPLFQFPIQSLGPIGFPGCYCISCYITCDARALPLLRLS